MFDTQTSDRLAELRQKVLSKNVSLEELKEAIVVLRQGRLTATARRKAQAPDGEVKPRAKKAPVDAQALFAGLEAALGKKG